MLDAIDEPGFWILCGGGLAAEILGYIFAKKMGLELLPLWELIVIMIVTVIAAAYFATRD